MNQENNELEKSLLKKTFTGETFLQNLTLLLVTAFLSGLIIPYLAEKNQKTNARNEIVLQSQNKLLEDISKTLLTLESLLGDISWYGSSTVNNPQMQQKAYERYAEKSAELLADLKTQALKAKILAPAEISEKIYKMEDQSLDSQDTRTHKLYVDKGTAADWDKVHDTNFRMITEVENLLTQMAIDMKLTKANLK